MHGLLESLGVAVVLTLLVALLAAAVAPAQVGAGGKIEDLRVYDAAAGEWPEGVAADKDGAAIPGGRHQVSLSLHLP